VNEQRKTVKVCKRHGLLEKDNIYVYKNKYLKCRLCARELKKKYRQTEKYKQSERIYRQKEHVKQKIREYVQSEGRKQALRKYNVSKKRKAVGAKYAKTDKCKESNSYIRRILKVLGTNTENISPQLIRIKRLFLKSKRLIKEEINHGHK
jgi:hypothetical protein